jgi:hypothetical protein
MGKRANFQPKAADRAIFAILALLHICNGVYLVGPWYLDDIGAEKAPLYSLFIDHDAVAAYGVLILLDGLFLAYAATAKVSWFNTKITANALLAGFLLRLYSLIGVFLTIDSWRPPSYLSHIATVCILGVMWILVRISERPTE